MAKKASQTINGKAFEYALLNEFFERLRPITKVSIVQSAPYNTAKKCFETFGEREKDRYKLVSSSAINFLLDVEPRLAHGISDRDNLQLEIVSDKKGQSGDVRDVLAIRSLQKWEIGISAKNNHRAVKHSRLSNTIDFGDKWLGIPCAASYFEEIKPTFNMLASMRKANRATRWDSIDNMHQVIYFPILNAFKKELERLDKQNHGVAAQKLVEYLIGNQDFYKVIKNDNKVEIQAYNLHGTLNLPFENIKPKAKLQKLKLPNRIIEIVYQEDSTTTLMVSMNEGWQISFRIHSASSRIESSLKFDINLVSAPHSLFSTQILVPKA